MDRIKVDPKYKGGSIRIAAASAAIDRGVPIDVVLNTGRWSNWQVFNKFYNRARLKRCGPEHWPNFVGLGSPFNTHMTDVC